MSTHEWDNRVAADAGTRAADIITILEREVNRLRDKVIRLEEAAFHAEVLIDDLIRERDTAIDRCVARVVLDGTSGPGRVTLGGQAGGYHGEGTA